MKKIILSVVVCLGLNASYLADKEVEEFNNIPAIKSINPNIIVDSVYDADNLYILTVKLDNYKEQIFLTKDKNTLIFGNALSRDGVKISAPLKNISLAKGKEAFSVGTGKDEYIFFTDPECPYCKEFEKYLPQIQDKVKINLFYYPILQIHPNAKELSIYQLHLKENGTNWEEALSKTTSSPDYSSRNIPMETKIKLTERINEQMKIAEDFGVQGTPTIFNTKGEQINWVLLLESLGVKVR